MDDFDDVINEYHGQRGGHVWQYDCGHSTFIADGTYYPW